MHLGGAFSYEAQSLDALVFWGPVAILLVYFSVARPRATLVRSGSGTR